MASQPDEQTITIPKFPDTSPKKGNQTMNFGHLV